MYYIEFDGEKLLSPENKINYSTNLLKFLTDAYFLPDEAINEKFMTDHFKGFSLYLKLNESLIPGDNFYTMYGAFSSVNNANANTYLALTVLCALLSIGCFVGCCIISGKRKDDSVKLAVTDKIPFVLYLAFTVALVGLVGFGVGCMALIDFNFEDLDFIATDSALRWIFTSSFIRNVIGLGFALISLFLLSFVLYIVRNVKAGTFGNRFILVFIVRKIKSGIRKIKEKARLKGYHGKRKVGFKGNACYAAVTQNSARYINGYSDRIKTVYIFDKTCKLSAYGTVKPYAKNSIYHHEIFTVKLGDRLDIIGQNELIFCSIGTRRPLRQHYLNIGSRLRKITRHNKAVTAVITVSADNKYALIGKLIAPQKLLCRAFTCTKHKCIIGNALLNRRNLCGADKFFC